MSLLVKGNRENVGPMIRVAIVEDNAPLRAELRRLIDDTTGLVAVGDYGNAEDALAAAAIQGADVMLMDIELPGMNGVEAVRRLRGISPQTLVIMLTVFDHSDWIFDALRAGAIGYLLKRAPGAEIIAAIEQALDGGAPMSISIARKVVQFFGQRPATDAAFNDLTEREHVVLSKLSEGLTYDEIGVALSISINTVRKHIRAIYEKLEVNSRTEAVARFLRL